MGKIKVKENSSNLQKDITPIEEIHFQNSEKRNREIIGRIKDGRIALIDKSNTRLVQSGEDWLVAIVKDEISFVLVLPVKRIKTIEENEEDLKVAVNKLSDKFKVV